jgi:tetratricopeptide (TPR) repeat protein
LRRLSTFILASTVLFAVASTDMLAAGAALAQEPVPTLEQAVQLLADQDWPGATRAYQAITEAEPDNGAAWFGLGRAYFNGRQVDRALEAFTKTLELGFEPARTMIHLARCHALLGSDAEAIAWIEKAAATGAGIYQALETTPEFHRLRENPTFRELVEKGKPCNAPAYHLLDFWVSSWKVVVGEDQRQVGKNSIQKILNGCAIIENWQELSGGEGKSLFYYDEVEKTWKQVWITDSGGITEKHLVAVLGGGAVRFQGELRLPNGNVVLDRTTLIPLPENRVRQVIEQSADGGETWKVGFDALYLP